MKIEEFLEHRIIEKFGITKEGGLIIVFDDKSHTFIDPEEMKKIILNYSDLRLLLDEEEWKALLFFV